MLIMNDLKIGIIIKLDEKIYQVLFKKFIRYAKGKPVTATKLKDLMSGKIIQHTFQQSDKIEGVNIEKSKTQFLYQENNNFYFMDLKNYAQFSLSKEVIGRKSNFLKENTAIEILSFEDNPIDIILPVKINFKVTSAPPNTKGNSVQSGNKEIEIETGHRLKVPLFIEEGDVIKVNTEKGVYVERISD